MVIGKIVIVILCFVVASYFINNLDVFTDTHTNVPQSPAQVGVCVLGVLLSCAVALVVCWTMREGKHEI